MVAVPGYVGALTVIGAVGMPVWTGVVLYRGGLAAGVGKRKAAVVGAAVAAAALAWLGASAWIAAAGGYRQSTTGPQPWIGVALVGALAAGLLATRIPVLSRMLAEIGTPGRLALPQTVRAMGVTFLLTMLVGGLPAVFALPAGLGDIAVGVSAPFVARRWARERNARGAAWFNWLGILDLVVAVGIGFMAALGPIRLIPVTPSTEAVGMLPLALIPTATVPLALALHVVSLARIRAAAKAPVLPSTAVPAVG